MDASLVFKDLIFNTQALGQVQSLTLHMFMVTVKEENETETGNGWQREAPPSSGRDASLVFGDLFFNRQALG